MIADEAELNLWSSISEQGKIKPRTRSGNNRRSSNSTIGKSESNISVIGKTLESMDNFQLMNHLAHNNCSVHTDMMQIERS